MHGYHVYFCGSVERVRHESVNFFEHSRHLESAMETEGEDVLALNSDDLPAAADFGSFGELYLLAFAVNAWIALE